MFHRALWIAQGAALIAAALLTVSAVQAQTSAQGHVPAPSVQAPYNLRGLPAFGIYPGDHMFQATMKVQSTYQAAERAVPPVAVSRRPAPRVVVQTEPAAEVTVTEPAGPTELVYIRGVDGEVRAFPIEGGRKAIKARTIIVRPGQSLNLVVYGGRVTITTK